MVEAAVLGQLGDVSGPLSLPEAKALISTLIGIPECAIGDKHPEIQLLKGLSPGDVVDRVWRLTPAPAIHKCLAELVMTRGLRPPAGRALHGDTNLEAATTAADPTAVVAFWQRKVQDLEYDLVEAQQRHGELEMGIEAQQGELEMMYDEIEALEGREKSAAAEAEAGPPRPA